MREIQKYIPVIGLEVHVELKTASKMFCSCRNDPFGADKPNIYTCPVCLGLPGALPVPNKKAVELTVKLGLGLGCGINKESRFDRKHYFYPDLPKGYQISQYERPFCVEGKIKIGEIGEVGGIREIRVRRVHLEEDTGKLLHRKIDGEEVSLIDFNRSGVPLAEIVTEPDIRSAQDAKETAKKIHQIIRSLGVSDADMEKGSMRLEANISLAGPVARHPGPTSKLPNYKVEIKNINSFRFLEKAINAEIERQERILSAGKKVQQQTFGWDTEKQELKPQRVKEEAADYRYFPEPDIPPIELSDQWISEIRNQISKMPEEIYGELVKAGIAETAARVISGDKKLAEKINGIIREIREIRGIREIGNWVLHHQAEVKEMPVGEIIELFNQGKVGVVSDSGQLESWVLEAINANPQAVSDFKAGKQQAVGFLIGQVQRLAKGKADVTKVVKIIKTITGEK
jgi:aspartyl-tRNA(Asn)/glutamyl-tRNA(Gln) amidotransferase subunit B